ncbi:MAG: aspartate dehydrogenase [Candidatus Omnitrophica bacterium]|nr:aspartate dehydrogenase [Candidatus Omnitrophota bacterium]
MPKLKIGIVGCGAIGSSLAKVIVRDFAKDAQLTALYDIDKSKSIKLSRLLKKKSLGVRDLSLLIKKSRLVIEASSAKSSWDISRKALSSGRDIMIMSVGGVVSNSGQLRRLAIINNCKVYIPSGAICGVDALKAARVGKIKKVTLTTRKNPLSFKGVKYIEEKGISLSKIKNDKVLFSGLAKDAVKYFPQNINVAAVLSMAGIGQNKTRVNIIASPKVSKNIHEIRIEAGAGNVFSRTENILHPDNPKTSFLAVLSAIATLKQILEPVRIGT